MIPGHQIRDFRIVRKLGEGGMATVWEVERREKVSYPDEEGMYWGPPAATYETRRYAAKVVKPEWTSLVADEISILQAAEHPNVIRFVDAFENAGQKILIMELAEKSIAQELQLDSTTPKCYESSFAAPWLAQIASGLEHLHSKNIVHRDIKPHNILVVGMQPKLSDLGIAKYIQRTLTTHTGIHTPAYAAPEMFEFNQRRVGKASDVWSLGVTAYQMLTGDLPFRTPYELQYSNPRMPTGLSDDVSSVIVSCLHKDPVQRPNAPTVREQFQKIVNLTWIKSDPYRTVRFVTTRNSRCPNGAL